MLILFFNYEIILRVLCGLEKSLNLGYSKAIDQSTDHGAIYRPLNCGSRFSIKAFTASF